MGFTLVTVSATYHNEDGTLPTPGSSVTLQATATMQNGTEIRVPTRFSANLDGAGAISIQVPATDDVGTQPLGVSYEVIERISGTYRKWLVVVPHTSPTLNLASAAPALPANAVFGYALDSQVVHQAGAETITGAKRSTQLIVLDKLPGDATTSTPVDVIAGQQWDWGGERFDAMAAGLKGDGTNEDMTKLATLLAKNGVIFFGDRTFKFPTPATIPVGARIRGTATWDTGGTPKGTLITGTAGQNIFNLTDTAAGSEKQGVLLEGLAFSGGTDQIYAPNGGYGVTLKRIRFSSASHAGIYLKGFIQEWFADTLDFAGGQYGIYFNNEVGTGSSVLFDKSEFANVYCHGQSINGLVTRAGSNVCTWDHIRIVNAVQDGWVIGGSVREWTVKALGTEANGFLGSTPTAPVTGTGSNGSTTLTVSSGTGYANGDTITIAGGGNTAGDQVTTISSGGGTTTWTLAAALTSNVTNAEVTKFTYSDVKFSNSPASPGQITFIDPQLGNGAGAGGVKYAIDAAQASGITVINGGLSRPIYDPLFMVTVLGSDSTAYLRRPRPVYLLNSSTYTTYPLKNGQTVEEILATDNLTIMNQNPNVPKGLIRTWRILQDGVGGRTVAWDTQYKFTWSNTGNTLGKQSTISGWWDGTAYQQMGAQTPYV